MKNNIKFTIIGIPVIVIVIFASIYIYGELPSKLTGSVDRLVIDDVDELEEFYELRVGSPTREYILYVDSSLVDCFGMFEQKCMFVREDGGWELFYDSIVGFDYEEGYRYKLKVQEADLIDPPMDVSSIRTTLVEVLEKKKVDNEKYVNKADKSKNQAIMKVRSVLVDCYGLGPEKCMQVNVDGKGDHYMSVEGFEFVAGYEYVLLVKVMQPNDPVVDYPRPTYSLIEVLDKKQDN